MTVQPTNDVKLEKVLNVLVAEFKPEKVYLFGSMARGSQGADSDYDLMLVLPKDIKKDKRAEDRAYELLFDLRAGIAVDVLVWEYEAFHKRTHLVSSLPNTILDEGKLLYVA